VHTKRTKMDCDPTNYYCLNPSDGDKAMISFYAANTGLPGPLVRSKPVWSSAEKPIKLGPARLRQTFQESEYLSYASPEMKEMRGAPYMRGGAIQQYNVENIPFDGTHTRRASAPSFRESMYYTPMYTPVEKCGCGASPGDSSPPSASEIAKTAKMFSSK
jgi:hypothetical protein